MTTTQKTRVGNNVYTNSLFGGASMHHHWCCVCDSKFRCYAEHKPVQFAVCPSCEPKLKDENIYEAEHTHTCRGCGTQEVCSMEEGHGCVVAVYFCPSCNRLPVIQDYYANAQNPGREYLGPEEDEHEWT